MISPSIGRKVWYYPATTDANMARHSDQPFSAEVVHVWSDTCVNLAIFDHRGTLTSKTSVTLAQDRDALPGECAWMPYQKGQAAKTEALESQVKVEVPAA